MRLKTLAGVAFSAAAVLVSAAPAFAAEMSANPTANLVDGQAVNVSWSGFANPTFMSQCSRSVSDPTFVPELHCDFDTNGGVVVGPTSGTATINVFKGDRPLLGWACGATAEGLELSTTCYIRITDISQVATANDIEVPFTYAPDVEPVIPEVPYSVLLPLGAVAAIGAGVYLNRRRIAA